MLMFGRSDMMVFRWNGNMANEWSAHEPMRPSHENIMGPGTLINGIETGGNFWEKIFQRSSQEVFPFPASPSPWVMASILNRAVWAESFCGRYGSDAGRTRL
ncbi:hypothetical protein J3458_005369 [Metarhizium acridum]|uniref:uncharacterized protein n=1 Tax=Metarhizium acridum TaxID=92637 RepID=UPI001C6AFF44|nr:hypothetical protein J3458_005369 [Metarhizium acridum]